MSTANQGPVQTKILLVHGMLMERYNYQGTRERWADAIIECLGQTSWGARNRSKIPSRDEIDLVFWGDLYRPPTPEELAEQTKGLFQDAADAFYGKLREVILTLDRNAKFGADGRPQGRLARLVAAVVSQAAFYMHNGAVVNPRRGVAEGAYDQIQALFVDKVLPRPPAVVIGHSLGTVIAYEGLCRTSAGVDTLVTVGSPLATPHLIVEPLRERLHETLGGTYLGNAPLPVPPVQRWVNFYATADVWSVPVPQLAPLFPPGSLEEIVLRHESPFRYRKVHRITTYLREHPQRIGDVIAAALERRYP